MALRLHETEMSDDSGRGLQVAVASSGGPSVHQDHHRQLVAYIMLYGMDDSAPFLAHHAPFLAHHLDLRTTMYPRHSSRFGLSTSVFRLALSALHVCSTLYLL